MGAEKFQNTLIQKEIEVESFLEWFAKEFTIWQNIGAFDSTELGFNAEGDIVYQEMYDSYKDYIADEAFDASVLGFHIQDFKGKSGYVDDLNYQRYLTLDRTVVAAPVSLDDVAAYFPNKKVGAEKFSRQRQRAVELWLMAATDLGRASVQEVTGTSGKNNLGIFRVKTGQGYIVKVVIPSALSQFKSLERLNESFEKLEDPEFPRIARIVNWGPVGGVAMGLFEVAEGQSLEDLHEGWVRGEKTDEEMTGIYGSVGSSMGAFNLSGVSASGSKSKRLGAKARMHGDANPSNLFVDVNDENRTTLIDNEGISLEGRVDASPYELNSLLFNFNEATFREAGVARTTASSPVLTKAERRVQSELRMFHAFAQAYAAKAPESIKEYVIGWLQDFLTKYLGWYITAAEVSAEKAKTLIPEFGQKIE